MQIKLKRKILVFTWAACINIGYFSKAFWYFPENLRIFGLLRHTNRLSFDKIIVFFVERTTEIFTPICCPKCLSKRKFHLVSIKNVVKNVKQPNLNGNSLMLCNFPLIYSLLNIQKELWAASELRSKEMFEVWQPRVFIATVNSCVFQVHQCRAVKNDIVLVINVSIVSI